MSTVHKALEALHPRAWSEIPQGEDLKPFLLETLSQAETIISSVPQPPGGDPFDTCRPSASVPHINAAKGAADIHASTARIPDPDIDDLQGLQKGWGKPLKINAKENQLGVSVWKMAGHDRHGAWFARRSVHEGLGFEKWKAAMQREFPHSLAIDGGPGEGSVRGIGADQRLEKHIVEGVGQLEVLQLSAQFPGPVAPREFVTCLITSESALSEISAVQSGSTKSIPRHWMVVSLPCDHPDAPPKDSPVRGQYESVELIREIPLNSLKAKSTPSLPDIKPDVKTSDTHRETIDVCEHNDDDPEMNPVEWIMITRSDPGGGIPRFMVERGTPSSITGDATKFLNWATSLEEIPDPDHDVDKQAEVQERKRQASADFSAAANNGHLAGVSPFTSHRSMAGAFEPSRPGETGIIASLTHAVETYTPDVVKNSLGYGDRAGVEPFPDYDSSSDTSYESVPERTADWQTAYEGPHSPDVLDSDSSLSYPGLVPDNAALDEQFKQSSDHKHYERELEKLSKRRATLTEKMENARLDDEKKREELATKERKDAEKQRERLEKEKQKSEERFMKEMQKIEQKKKREEEKVEAKRKKARDKDANARDRREKEEYRRRVELLQRENELLRRQLGDLQKENTMLVQKIGKMHEGGEVVRSVRQEMEKRTPRNSSEVWGRTAEMSRERPRSLESRRSLGAASKRSGETGKSKLSGMSSASEEQVAS